MIIPYNDPDEGNLTVMRSGNMLLPAAFFRYKKTGAPDQRRFKGRSMKKLYIDTSSPEGKEEKPAG